MLDIIIWDVQHGSAAYIDTPNNKHIAIDLGIGSYGSSDKIFSPLSHIKNEYKVTQLDAVIITHPHRDHLDDIFNFDTLAPKVLHRPKHLSDDEIIKGNRTDDKEKIDKYLEINKRYSVPVGPTDDLRVPANVGEVEFKFFIPTGTASTNLNNHSLVTVISYAKSKIIIPGDNEPESWNELLADKNFESAIKGTDIFLAPHHGRVSGYSPELFEKLDPLPYLCVISDGRFSDTSATNRYSAKARGWPVQYGNGKKEDRKCLTTRSDGWVRIRFGYNEQRQPVMGVHVA